MTITCPNELPSRKESWYVFLAGPIQGGPNWQHNMPEIPNVIWLSPRRENYENFNWNEQTDWETKCMKLADIILFWIPDKVEDIKGRDYAMTTRTEFGEYLAMGKKIIASISPDFPGRRYLELKAKQYNAIYFGETLEESINALKSYILSRKQQTFFTSDTHFSSQRALDLSKRPFTSVPDMDWNMIERWNRVVGPNDVVCHLGDFGCLWPMKYLNGTINLVLGNYERKEVENSGEEYLKQLKESGIIVLGDNAKYQDYILAHEPIKAKDLLKSDKDANFSLFGHIHGRQRVKKFGIDVGVDSNNYTPMSLSDIEFYRNAIEKGYYDDEVWVE